MRRCRCDSTATLEERIDPYTGIVYWLVACDRCTRRTDFYGELDNALGVWRELYAERDDDNGEE